SAFRGNLAVHVESIFQKKRHTLDVSTDHIHLGPSSHHRCTRNSWTAANCRGGGRKTRSISKRRAYHERPGSRGIDRRDDLVASGRDVAKLKRTRIAHGNISNGKRAACVSALINGNLRACSRPAGVNHLNSNGGGARLKNGEVDSPNCPAGPKVDRSGRSHVRRARIVNGQGEIRIIDHCTGRRWGGRGGGGPWAGSDEIRRRTVHRDSRYASNAKLSSEGPRKSGPSSRPCC